MSISSILAAVNPFAKAAITDLDKAISDVNTKAQSDIAALRASHAAAQVKSTLAQKERNFEQFVSDYKAYLASLKAAAAAPAAPVSVGPTGATGPHA